MARLLIRLIDKINPVDIDKNELLSKAGDIIVVRDDGWVWGLEEILPTYGKIDVVGPGRRVFDHLLAPQGRPIVPPPGMSQEDAGFEIRRWREQKVDIELLPAAKRVQLETEGTIELTLGEITSASVVKPERSD